MSDSELDDAAAELYAVDPQDFIAARTAAAASAKESGDRKLAAAIGKLRKPTTVGWMVNLLVREEPGDIADLFDLGDSLRDAQRRSSADELRELSAARAHSISALTRRAVEIAREHGHSSAENAARDVGQTLGAALADPEIGERVRAGRVVTAASYSGFGPATLSLAPEPETSWNQSKNRKILATTLPSPRPTGRSPKRRRTKQRPVTPSTPRILPPIAPPPNSPRSKSAWPAYVQNYATPKPRRSRLAKPRNRPNAKHGTCVEFSPTPR